MSAQTLSAHSLFERYDGVFGKDTAESLLKLAASHGQRFAPSKTSPKRDYPEWRRSVVLYDHEFRAVSQRLQAEVNRLLPEVCARLGVAPFPVESFEVQLTAHHDGDYFKWHADNGTAETAARTITFVYYFHRCPRRFAGGELVLYDGHGAQVELAPHNDCLVFFRSDTKHEVRRVECPSGEFEDGRFTLNGWVRRRMTRRSLAFDRRIFDAPARRYEKYRRPRSARSAPATTQPELLTRHAIDPHEFFRDHFAARVPVVFRSCWRDSPAVRRWSPEWFAEHYGEVSVEATSGRQGTAKYEQRFSSLCRKIRLADFVERLRVEPESNDFYIVARNLFFDHPELRHLRGDLEPPAGLIHREDWREGTAKLWFGPRGTTTPLHRDDHPILFGQIHGRKHVRLIAPSEESRLYVHDRWYSAVDLEEPDYERFPLFRGVRVFDIVVEPGDMLFLPPGWWHWVRSLDVSITATFCSFRRPPN